MFEVTMLIPTRSNAGELFTPAHYEAFERKAVELFGGFTLLPSTASGAWLDEGTLYRDTTRVYALAVPGLAQAGKVVSLAEFAKAHFGQEAIAYRYLGQFEIV